MKQNGVSYVGDDEPATSADGPRLVEEHHIRSPYGEDELEATNDPNRVAVLTCSASTTPGG